MIFRIKSGFIRLLFILISFFAVSTANAAKLYFNDVYKATGNTYSIQPSSLNSISFVNGTGFKFTSANPADVSFSGNNIAGILTYTDASNQVISIYGVISRQDKSGNTTLSVNFMPTDNTYTTVTGEGYILVVPSKEASYSNGVNVSTSSDPIASVLNDLLTTQNNAPIISVNDVTVSNTDSYAVFTVTLSKAASASISFSPALTNGSATLNTDYTSSMQYYNGSIWVNISSTVSIAQGATSLQIRVPILNGGGTSNRTFNLNTGVITGGNVLNKDGAYGVGTITPTPSIIVTNNLKTFTTCSGCTLNPQSFTVSGTSLTANITLTAPTGVVISATSTGTYGSSLTITQSSGTVTTTTIYAKLTSNATSTNSGVISVTSTGATSKTVTVTTNTDNALNFIGDGKKVLTGNTIFTDGQQNLTIEFWMKPTDATVVFRGIIGAQTTNSDRSPSLWQYGRKIHFDLYEQNNTTTFGGFTEEVLKIGEWNHVAMIKNGTSLQFIVNGSPVAIEGLGGATTKTVPANIKAVNNYQIGALDNFFTGSLDEIRFWSTARTETNINDNMFSELTGSETGLLSYISFNNGTISGNTSGITLNALGSINLSLTTSATIDIVAGFIPSIKATGNATTLATGNTLQLSNGLSGGTWASSNTGLATVNTSTGLVTGVASGSVNITYTVCDKTVTTNFTVSAPPTITISGKNSSNVTRVSGSKTNDATLTLTFTTSESTTNFAVADITVSGGSLSGFSGSGTTYTATLTPSGTGTITVDVNAGTFSNTNGLNNTAATQYVWIYDNTAPTITITGKNSSNTVRVSGSTTNDANLTITFTTSETTGNFTATDVTVSGGTLSNFTGSGTTYTATLTPAAPGTLTVNVNSSTFTDEAGNNNTAASTYTWIYTNSDPTCSVFNIADFTLNGNATQASNIITLTPDSFDQNGSAWNKKRIFFTENFDIKAKINLGTNDGGADGIAFVLQDKSLNAGSSGGGLGYQGITPSFAVEFDTYYNGGADPVSSDHISIVKNGQTGSLTSHSEFASTVAVSNMEDGVWRDVRFVWNAASKNFKVYYESVADNSIPIFNITVDLKASIFNNLDYAYWGFTSATGGAKNIQKVEISNYCYVPQVAVTNQPGTNNANALTSFCTGSNVVLQSDAGISYQWYKNGIAISGATARTLTVTESGIYKVEQTSNIGYTTTSEGISVNVDPLVLTQPTSPSVACPGTGTKTFTVFALGNGLTYQWEVSTDGGNNWTSINNGGIYSGATTTTLTLTNPTLAVNGFKYRVVLNGTCGVTATTDGLASISFTEPPSIATQPLSPNAICASTGTATLTVAANNASSYQWQVSTNNGVSWLNITNSAIYSGTTSSTLSIINPTSTYNNYKYRVVVTGACSPNATSDGTAKITVNALPSITTQPSTATRSYCLNANAIALSVVASGANLTYQWYSNTTNSNSGGTAISNATNASFTPPTTTTGLTYYYCVVSGTCSPSVTSNVSGGITVNELPSFTYADNSFSFTKGSAISAINPTSTGAQIVSYSASPALPTGLSINSTTGVITGTPSVVASSATRVITATTASGCTATFNISFAVTEIVNVLPQATVNAVDYGLLATDTVNLKMSITNGTAPFTLILNNSVNNTKDTITDLTPVNNLVSFKLKRLDTTKVFTIFKLIDANNNTRSSGFTKDTTIVNMLKPKILLTLKADPAVKQADNSFKTRLLLKVKNSGDLDLRNVQVNANLSSVFPVGINYVLDSVRVLAGSFALNPNYTGAGTATSASSIQFTATASTNGSKQSLAALDQNYLFNNGVSLNKDAEGEVAYYVSIGATTQNVTLKLQFETAGDGVLVKNDGSSSAQETTSKSDDGTNIAQHPDITNQGLPMPTYVPLFPNEKIGGSLAVSSATAVTGGYQYHFIAKIKNYGNVNLDSIRIQYNFNNMYPAPDQASLIGIPSITRGNIVYNTNVYDGYSDVNLFKYGGDLQVGDSATYEYDLKVTTNRTAYTWPNYFVVYGRSINSGVFINDTSMSGTNPDPNNDNDPAEQFFTKVTINFTPPAPPTVENKTYVYGTTKPVNISGLVKSTPVGTIPVWCDQKTAACSIIPPATPTEIGRYIFALRSYDTTTLLYSEVLVYDTVIIKPPVPIVMNKKYIIGNTSNPANVSNQVTGMSGSVLNYFKNASLQSVIPTLGTVPGVTRYTTSQTVNGIESDTVGFTVTMLDPKTMLHLRKIADEPKLQSNSTFNITYTFIVTNRTDEVMTNVLVADNLQNTFPSPTLFDVVSVSSTGGLVFNNAFNGKTVVQLLKATSSLAAAAIDTIRLTVNLQPKGYSGTVNNMAVITATTPYGNLSINSSSTSFANETVKSPTPAVIPDLAIDIPEAFSPNRDGVNDRFVILKPFGTTLELEVYNRWGNVVYYNANYNNEWDGRGTNNFIGQDLMDGGYYYTLKAKSVTGNSQIFKGFVLIQR